MRRVTGPPESLERRLGERRDLSSELSGHGIFNCHVRAVAPGSAQSLPSQQRFRGHPVSVVGGDIAVPGAVMLISKFPVIRTLGIYDTYPGLIVPLLAAATGVFIMKQFFESIPPSFEEAAKALDRRWRRPARPVGRVPRRNGVIDAADALGGRPGIFGSTSGYLASTLREVRAWPKRALPTHAADHGATVLAVRVAIRFACITRLCSAATMRAVARYDQRWPP